MKKIVLLLMLGVSPATATIPSWAVISYPDPDNDKFRVIDFPPNFCYGTLWKSETGGRWNHQVYLESPFGQRCYVRNVELLRRIMSVCPVLYDCVLKGDIRLVSPPEDKEDKVYEVHSAVVIAQCEAAVQAPLTPNKEKLARKHCW
jgi:hypothetical protein